VYVYRWDLDKTYLVTDFDSIRGLLRSATEPAEAKRAVPGAKALLRALSHRPGARVEIVSGSPVQLRSKLEEKLRLDGIRFECLTLKDTFGHLKRGQVRAVKGQLGYKVPILLQSRVGLEHGVRETLFGDDAEVDALAYTLYADAVAGRVTAGTLARVLEAGGAYPEMVDEALDALRRLYVAEAQPEASSRPPTEGARGGEDGSRPPSRGEDIVDRVFIRLERRVPDARFEPLGGRVVPVHSYWQAALVLVSDGQLDGAAAGRVLGEVARGEGLDAWSVAGLTQDLVRRGHVRPDVLDQVELPEALSQACRRGLSRLHHLRAPPPRQPATPIDWLRVVQRWR
jgi:Uncharacterized conserved protein